MVLSPMESMGAAPHAANVAVVGSGRRKSGLRVAAKALATAVVTTQAMSTRPGQWTQLARAKSSEVRVPAVQTRAAVGPALRQWWALRQLLPLPFRRHREALVAEAAVAVVGPAQQQWWAVQVLLVQQRRWQAVAVGVGGEAAVAVAVAATTPWLLRRSTAPLLASPLVGGKGRLVVGPTLRQ